MSSKEPVKTTDSGIEIAEIKLHLVKILASQPFSTTDRMQEFLSYVVTEEIEGRGKLIRGKTIVQDIYLRDISSDRDQENVVRVDAGRLRRRLQDYYEISGRNDTLRFHIDSGGYRPRFERVVVPNKTPPQNQKNFGIMTAIILLIALAAFSGGVVYILRGSPPSVAEVSQNPDRDQIVRNALSEKSPKTLQAANLVGQARRMIFPLFVVERQELVLDLYRQSIQLDSEYFGGYAGAAQTLGTLSILARGTDQSEELLQESKVMIEKAIQLGAAEALTQSSMAWVAFSNHDYARAQELTTRAKGLDPKNAYISDIHALITLFTGDFASAVSETSPQNTEMNSGHFSARRNIRAAAQFHLGTYQAAMQTFKEADASGSPINPARLAYQAATEYALGEPEKAQQTVAKLMATWPDFPIDTLLTNFYSDAAYAEKILSKLRSAGWTSLRN